MARRIQILGEGEGAEVVGGRHPYWAEGWGEPGGEAVGLVGFGGSGDLAAILESGEGGKVGRWMTAECYDEWSPRLARIARVRPGLVGWRPPDEPRGGEDAAAEEESRELLILVDGASRPFWVPGLLKMWRSRGRELEPVVWDLEGQEDWQRLKERLGRARICLSWLGDRQLEQWLLRCAAARGVGAWVSVNASGGPSLRYLGEGTRGLHFREASTFRRLRSMFRALDELEGWSGRAQPAWDDSWHRNSEFVRWVLECRTGEREHALVGKVAGEEVGERFAGRLALDAVVETVNASVAPQSVQPLARAAASDGWGGSLEALLRCHYSREWAEVLIYLSFRRPGLWNEALAEAKEIEAKEGAWGQRIRMGIGCALVEKLLLEVAGFRSEEALRALEILQGELRDGGGACADLATGAGLAAVLAGRQDLVEGLADRLAAVGGDVSGLYGLIGEHLGRAGSDREALDWLEREERRIGRSDSADVRAIDALCELGEFRAALGRAEGAADAPAALAHFATFRLRPGRRCRALNRDMGWEESELCQAALERLEGDSVLLARARALHAARLGRRSDAEAACRALAELAGGDWEAVARLRLDFASLGLALPFLLELGEVEGKVDRLEQCLQLALLAGWEDDLALAERTARLLEKRSRLEDWATCSVSSLQGVYELRDDLIFFSWEWGWDEALFGGRLERRLVAKHGRSIAARHRSPGNRVSCRVKECLGELKLAGQLAISALEPRFLDV